jgi:hypothetical protein
MTLTITPGRAHFVVECAGCGARISLGEASDVERTYPHTSPFEATCPNCRMRATYAPAQVSRRYGSGDHGPSLLD